MAQSETSSLRAPALATIVASVLVVGLAATGLVSSSPGPVLLAGLATLVAGACGMALIFRASRQATTGRATLAIVVGALSILAVVVVSIGVLAVLFFLMGYGDPRESDAASPRTSPVACTPITAEQNEMVADGMSREQVEAVVGRQLVLRDKSQAEGGSSIEVYEWKQFASEDGCDQYASYEFQDGQLVFRRWTPAN